jgi:hypothetical protein
MTMATYEYKVIPAPLSGKRAKGVKGADGRFANALSEAINEHAIVGWEYIRAESLPSVERKGVMRKRHESYQNVLVFRRSSDAEPIEDDAAQKDTFNPFKRFSSKTQPVVAAPDVQIISEDTTQPATVEEAVEDASEELKKLPSKPKA